MKLATAGYCPEWHRTWDELSTKIDKWVAEAAEQGAELLIFPEYAGIEAALIGQPQDQEPKAWVQAMCDAADRWDKLHSDSAQKYDVHILAGSLCKETPQGPVNTAPLCSPTGQVVDCPKLIPTPYERDDMGIVGGETLAVIDTALGRLAVLICYDSEFPLLARAALEAGADMILVPSCTEFLAGQTRVRQSCRARAIEGQCLVVQSPLVGAVRDCVIVDQNTGRTGVFGPPDHGLPQDGILSQGDTDVEGWLYCDVDLAAISAPRTSGQVGNYRHWPEQNRHIKPPKVQTLS